ncbi:unnamed protein product [Adineta ricciae]|uniref:protein-disulfide reductase n=1 Tax=Adineta ricciae TaxID=249248 RepID=A0A815V893_ADIRI|nr:unnamed protein product [Adineta ricciae]
MIRSFSSSGSTVVRQTGSTQTVRMQSITTSSVRRYQKTESTVISTGGWSQQFSATSIGHQWADQDRAFMLTEPRIMANEVLQKLESIKITEEDCALTRQKIDYILCEIKTMTEEEIKAAHTKFMEICPNGKMTRTMFANVLQEVFSEGNASDYCRYAFKLFDRDNNGTLSFTEFVFAMQIYSSNDLEDSLGLVFDIFDCDKSGTIDKKEIVQMIIATSALTDNSLEIQDAKNLTKQIMQSCDVRRVGKITKTEFVNGCKNLSEYCKVLVPGYDEDDYVATTSVLTELLGEQLLQHDTHGSTGTSKYIATSELGYKIIGLYFSGHWCPPSRDFTPKLVEAYKSIDHSMQDKFDIVLVSSDNDQNAFDHYFQEMPWKALPFSDRTRKQALVKKFNVKRIPCLIVLSSSGEVLTSKGVAEINAYGADSIRRWLQEETLLGHTLMLLTMKPD